MTGHIHYPSKMYRQNRKYYEPYYSCKGCGRGFRDSNPLLVHTLNCWLYKILVEKK